MKQHAISIAALCVALFAAFLAGRNSQVPALDAQGAGGVTRPDIPLSPQPGLGSATGQPGMVVYSEDNGTSSATSNGILAVTGSYGVGTSVLYVIDTNSKQLSVYEARGGSRSMRRLTLVGARRIDLDLQLRGYNDESEYSYASLERMFDDRRRQADRAGTSAATEASTSGR